MAQIGWVFLDDSGGRHRVGLYHGDRSGHVMIYCNLRVVQVDFAVKESRTYSIFIEDELCEVQIVKENNIFTYAFEVNKKVDTPRNRIRRVEDRRNRKYMAIFIGSVVLVIGLFFWGIKWYERRRYAKHIAETSLVSQLSPATEKRLAMEGKTATVQLLLVQEHQQRSVFYGFLTPDSIRVSGQFDVPMTGMVMLPNGFALNDRDAFDVRYLPSNPQTHLVDFSHPTEATVVNYAIQAAQSEKEAHPEESPGKCACLANLVIQEKGWYQLGNLIFQSKTAAENTRFNHDSYLRLLREPDFAGKLKTFCWDK